MFLTRYPRLRALPPLLRTCHWHEIPISPQPCGTPRAGLPRNVYLDQSLPSRSLRRTVPSPPAVLCPARVGCNGMRQPAHRKGVGCSLTACCLAFADPGWLPLRPGGGPEQGGQGGRGDSASAILRSNFLQPLPTPTDYLRVWILVERQDIFEKHPHHHALRRRRCVASNSGTTRDTLPLTAWTRPKVA